MKDKGEENLHTRSSSRKLAQRTGREAVHKEAAGVDRQLCTWNSHGSARCSSGPLGPACRSRPEHAAPSVAGRSATNEQKHHPSQQNQSLTSVQLQWKDFAKPGLVHKGVLLRERKIRMPLKACKLELRPRFPPCIWRGRVFGPGPLTKHLS